VNIPHALCGEHGHHARCTASKTNSIEWINCFVPLFRENNAMNLQTRGRRLMAEFSRSGTGRFLLGLVLVVFSALPAHAQTITPATGYWLNPNASGSGFVIEVQGSKMFMAGFLYAANGEATWVASVGPMTSPTVYSQPLITFSGGQTLTGAYVPPVEGANSPGNISITFTDDSHASLTWPGGTFQIQRFDIVPGGSTTVQPATNPETGWWFNPEESGRGFAIEVQNNHMYFAGYMYDPVGNPTWYLAYGPMDATNLSLFQGEWTTFANGQTLTGAYVPPIQNNAMAGTVTLQFTSAYTATLTLPDNRQIPLIRFGFGVSSPVLTAFTPAAGAAPEALMTVTGTGFDPNGVVTLNLSDSSGYSVTIPVAAVTSTSVKVSVPPYISASTSAFGSGTVNLEATQKSNGVSLASNTLSGFNIQALPTVPGTAGNSTLALIQADLAEAQKLQTSIAGTAQNTPAVASAIAQQVTDLQGLVTNIQNVVQNGQSYSLGTVGGVDITVTPTNISDVDSLILAALQALANPTAGSLLKTAQAAPGPACFSAEASAFANSIAAGSSNLAQLAQDMLEAPTTSSACNTSTAFASAYQIFGGAADTGLGIANGNGGGLVGGRLPGIVLFAATSDNASAAVGLNALTSPQLSTQVTSVQTAIANVTAQSDPTANQLIARSSGALNAIVSGAQTVVTTAAPPPATTTTSTSGVVTEFSAGLSAYADPYYITVGPDGNLWFTESFLHDPTNRFGGNQIGRMTTSGVVTEFSAGISQDADATEITLGPDGNLWFTEGNGNRIARITPAGVVTEFSTGISPNAYPFGITAGPDGNIWFTEFTGNQIGRITPAGVVTEFSAGMSPNAEPWGIVAGPDGNLWFTENGNGIGRITPQGVITEFTQGITPPANPVNGIPGPIPNGLAVGPDGNLWFTEQAGNRIGRITMAGVITEFSAGITDNSNPSEITAGPDGNLWFTEPFFITNGVLVKGSGNQVARISTSGVVTEFSAGITSGAVPWGIVGGPDGNIWFTEQNGNAVARITP
jgi:streptogramin lyase